jgi:hypothetical protein
VVLVGIVIGAAVEVVSVLAVEVPEMRNTAFWNVFGHLVTKW